MTTILSATRTGAPTLLCDQRCYNAKTERCTCICEGLNHGAGERAARQNTRDYFPQIARAISIKDPRVRHVRRHHKYENLLFDFLKHQIESQPCLLTKSTSPATPEPPSPAASTSKPTAPNKPATDSPKSSSEL